MLRFTIIILLIVAVAGCANPQAPSGGPRDTRPPQILSQSLDDRTINFDGNRITLEFDKYMDKVKMQESIFISPDADFQVRWRGKKMQINLTSELEENTTYILNLGTEYSDILGNKPAEAFSIVFSTGSIIDSGTVTGRIYANDPTKISVMAYRLDNILVDSLDIRNVKPNYRTSVGTNSLFNIQGLPDGKFRIIAINDINRDGLYSEGTDEFGAFTQDVEVIDAVAENVKIYVGGVIDVIPPQLSGTRSVNNSEFTANFTKSLDSNSLSINSFTLNKENSTDTLEIASVYFVDKSANQLRMVLREPITDIESRYYLKAVTDSLYAVRDTAGNIINDSLNFAYVTFSENPRADIYKFNRISIRDSIAEASSMPNIDLLFETGIDTNGIGEKIEFIELENKKTVEFDIGNNLGNILRIKPKTDLKYDTWYRLNAELNGLQTIDGKQVSDTTIKRDFKVFDIRDRGELSGTFETVFEYESDIYIILKQKGLQNRYVTKVINNQWSMSQLVPGVYTMELFYDANKNGKFDYGNAFPFRFSEPFKVLDSEIEVRSRWKVENINIIWD